MLRALAGPELWNERALQRRRGHDVCRGSGTEAGDAVQRNEVVFVDGVRTPFGRAGEKGMYWNTRADDLIVKAIAGVLERHPSLPKERVDDVAVAATTQQGDQGLTLGRTAGLLAGLPRSVPGYAIDRMCAGAMTR